jgi:hypothetical protein
MAGLFKNLPPPTAPTIEEQDEEVIGQPESKRARREEEPTPVETIESVPPSAKEEQQPPSKLVDPILAALHRITSHIANPKKFTKASELLRQLLTQSPSALDVSNRRHGNAVFTALVASMEEDPSKSNDPLLAREYSKLFTVASKRPELFTPAQRAQLDIYGLWAVVLNQLLTTDDSFMFSKTVNTIKEMISELPVLEFPEQVEEEEKAFVSPYEVGEKNKNFSAVAPAAREDGELEEKEVDKDDDNTRVWSEVAIIGHRRAALTSCIQSGKECYKNLWARTSIDLLVEHASKHAQHSNQHFLPSQCAVIEEMVAFVREQKVARKTKGGSGGGGGGGDVTAFDRARADWGKSTLSSRGGVGSGGDHKSEAWLG